MQYKLKLFIAISYNYFAYDCNTGLNVLKKNEYIIIYILASARILTY